MGSAVSAASGVLGGIVGGIADGMTPKIQNVDQNRINDQVSSLQGQTENAQKNQAELQRSAGLQANYAQVQAQRAADINNGGDVQSALNLLQTQANGSAPSAAEGVLQQGKDQAISTQMAMANSGNLSQMIGGQKTAMDNAANLTQQSANQASQLRANQQAIGQQAYAGAAGQQASQAGVNAANANQLTNIQQNAALGYGGLANSATTNAGQLGLGATGISQGVQTQNAQNQVQAVGGLMNGGGAAMAMMSDVNQKTNIQPDSQGSRSWQEISDFFTGKYQKKKDQQNADNDMRSRMDKDASESEYLTSDEDQKKDISSDRAARAKGISDFFKEENKKPEPKKEESSDSTMKNYGDETPSQKAARQIKEGFMSSDENGKEDIKKGSMIHAFLDKLEPVTFDYKNPDGEMGRTPGKHMGIIAQDVEKAPGGESMVIDTPEGKAIDMASAMGMLMSAAADAHERMSSMEELFKSKKKVK